MRNERGVSLVQVIISLGILSGLFVAAMKLMQQQTQLGESSSYRFEALIVTDEIKSILADPSSCRATLGGKSAVFDDVEEIRSFDPAFKETRVSYAISKKSQRPLGQKDLFLQQISLNGNLGGFPSEQGYTMVILDFSDQLEGGKPFQTMFPVKGNVNPLGRIEGCQASPGIHQEKISRTLKDPWIKVRESKESETIQGVFYNGKVMIGKVSPTTQLNIEGGLLLMEFGGLKECNEETLGTMTYIGHKGRLYLCTDYGEWAPLNGDEKLYEAYKTFTLKTSSTEPVSKVTPEKYSFCRLDKMKGEGGQCTTSVVNKKERKNQWEYVAQHFRGRPVECTFICYR